MDTAADPAELVRLYLAGRVDNRLLRGRTSLPHAVQAAQYFAREATGADRIDAFTPTDVDVDVDKVRVVLKDEANEIEVILQKQFSEPLFSQCSAQVAGRVRTFGLVSLTTS